MQTNQTGIHLREEVLPQKEHQPERQNAENHKADGKQFPVFERGLQQLLVAAAESLKAVLESALESSKKGPWLCRAVLVAAHDEHHHGRDQSSR